ncbi:MAG: hypothetical protein H7239_14255 [Flavobacterium sp.]|nr:hypothetical protein [Flavobacterium sp.]
MSSVKNLKKDINFVLGDIIEAVYIYEMSTSGKPSDKTNAIIDEAIASFDSLIVKVNAKKVENKKVHFKQINIELEQTANQLIDKINTL